MEGPLVESPLQEKGPASRSIKGSFVVYHAHARSYLEIISRWVVDAPDIMDEASRVLIAQCFADLLVKLADAISKIVADGNISNDVDNPLLLVLPNQLFKSNVRFLVCKVKVQEQRFLRLFPKD